MKKLLSKPIPSSGHSQGSCIGRSWALPRHTVTVEEVIAEGGFGVVFLARGHGAQKFALKRIIVNNEHDLAVATREIQIMTSLGDHPNLLACLDYLVTPLGGGVTEVLGLMPYCRGSLLALLNARMSAKSHLSEKEVLQILADVVNGVARLHQCATPIIHRDLKIENILEDDGKFLICDFGSATPKCWDPTMHGVTATQEDLEKYTTLAYRSPEMVDLYSNRGPISTKADIWALGVLLFKMCFYTTPFGDSILAIQSAHVTFPPTSPFSTQLHALIQYLLKSDSTQRPDIFQVAELCYSLLGLPNPVTNVSATPLPPAMDSLVAAMTSASLTAKIKAEEKPIKSASVTPAPVTALATSVTPRQRPKVNFVVPGPVVGAALLPPPKSPKPIDTHHQNNSLQQHPQSLSQPTPSHHQQPQLQQPPQPQVQPNQIPSQNPPPQQPQQQHQPVPVSATNSSQSLLHQPPTQPPIQQAQIPNPISDHGHRRNVSDSSAFDKGSLQQSDLQSASSETVISSSWNPFAGDCFPVSGTPAGSVTGTGLGSAATATTETIIDDDPFAKAPFDYFKYRPMGVDLFGSAPFSNPFLEFDAPPNNDFHLNSLSLSNPQLHPHSNNPHPPTAGSSGSGRGSEAEVGVTNLSFED